MKKANLCSSSLDEQEINKCANELKALNLPLLSKRPDNSTSTTKWNYSPDVESYYPKGYIDSSMWNMSIFGYDDSFLDKGYKYHTDNCLPGIDIGISATSRPNNVVAFLFLKD